MILKKIYFLIILLLIPFLTLAQTYQTDNGHAEFTGHTPRLKVRPTARAAPLTCPIQPFTFAFLLKPSTPATASVTAT